MDKLNNRKVKTNVNTSYQRDIERSFSVIYHNLKRIQEERPKEGNLTRRNSEPHLSSPNAALPQRNEETGVLQRSNSSKGSNPLRGKTRRVSFSHDIVTHASISDSHTSIDTREFSRGQETTDVQGRVFHRSYSDPQNRVPNLTQMHTNNSTSRSRTRMPLTVTKAPDQSNDKAGKMDGIKQTLTHEFKRLRVVHEECPIPENRTMAER